jgi:cathepsin L
LANFLLNNRPIGVCGRIGTEWKNYGSGVISTCDGLRGGHCVLLVGAVSDGTSVNDNNYWRIRNSWGTGWGE